VAADLDRLRQIPLFEDFSDEALQRIAELATEIEVPAGTVLAMADDPGSGMYIVEEGRVVVEGRGGLHKELGSGEFFGELTLLVPDAHRVARVRAATDVRCVAIRRDDFTQLIEAEPVLAVAMLPTLARRLVDVMQPD
jgi:CRP/FNR family transcriptional regulator, cyclic AMP receptor protein